MERVISLCDLTGNMVLPWAENGFECFVFDVQHPYGVNQHELHPNIKKVGDSIMKDWIDRFFQSEAVDDVHIAFADLTGSGARWWRNKGERAFVDAMALLTRCRDIVDGLGCPWMLENPPGRINSGAGFDEPHPARWEEKWDHRFQPFQYGGWDGSGREFWERHGAQLFKTFVVDNGIDAENFTLQRAKEYTSWLKDSFDIEMPDNCDGYHKSTCLWTGNGFRMPEPRPVGLHAKADKIHKCAPGEERANIRSATPMGFARAVYEANH